MIAKDEHKFFFGFFSNCPQKFSILSGHKKFLRILRNYYQTKFSDNVVNSSGNHIQDNSEKPGQADAISESESSTTISQQRLPPGSLMKRKLTNLTEENTTIQKTITSWIKSTCGEKRWDHYKNLCNEIKVTCEIKDHDLRVTSGVPQGSHLGPLLFNLFIHDIGSCFENSHHSIYADDLKIFKSISTLTDSQLLQRDINNLQNYCVTNYLSLNVKKCHYIRFSRLPIEINFLYNIDNKSLSKVEVLKDLGVMIDSKLTFEAHIEKTVKKALRNLGFISRITKSFKNPKSLLILYNSLVRSHLEFASIVWNPYYYKYIERVERVQMKFMNILFFKFKRPQTHLSYESRLQHFNLSKLSSWTRRIVSYVIFLFKIFSNRVDSLYAHGAILAALIKRSKTGRGQKIDCNLLSTQVASLINIGSNYLNAGIEAKRWGTAHGSIVPYESFPTKDGYFTLGTGSDLQYKEFCEKIGHPELAEDKKYSTNKLRVKHRDELLSFLRSVFITKSNQEWSKIFDGCSFPCGPVNTLTETFNDPHIRDIGLVESVEHPVAGKVKIVGPPVVYSEGGNFVRKPSPTLGQHTNEIMTEILGFDKNTIDALRTLILPTHVDKSPNQIKKGSLQGTLDDVSRWCQKEQMSVNPSKTVSVPFTIKKTLGCCIFDKPRVFGESSDESDDECDHCQGHVEKKNKPPSSSDSVDGAGSSPVKPDSSQTVTVDN
ncbi:unnamed protein product [Phaedon cochleariae]|uniref:Reverse transcriptase domain-containing protein n=1 Tax=Phaedon cochleariae TaxID=80249 RepID=A0A9N9X0U4_PHACE|nr:unnamed protein product [Phaedon cochleariae]